MTLVVPRITTALLTNSAFGYPNRGNERRVDPIALACIHITANKPPVASAAEERTYANRPDSPGPSAHFYIDRTGPAVQAIDWKDFAAWSNGDVKEPAVSEPGVQKIVDFRAKGYNANEAYGVEIECCGYEPGYPVTASQIRSSAYLVALAKLEWPEIPISTATVHPHRYLNTVDKWNCPGTDAEKIIADIVRVAHDYFEVLSLQAEIAELTTIIDVRGARIKSLEAAVAQRDATIDAQTGYIDAINESHAAKLAEWADYADRVKSAFGQGLAIDTPTP
jgi:hypothetical protein